MRKFCLAAVVTACLACPSAASADVVLGAGVFDFGYFSGGAQVNLTAGISAGDGAPLGLLAFSFPQASGNNSIVGGASLECLRVEGNKASLIAKSLNGPNSFGNQVVWIEDRGLLGLFGARDRVEGHSFPGPGDHSVCPDVTPPGGFQHDLPAGDFTVLDLP